MNDKIRTGKERKRKSEMEWVKEVGVEKKSCRELWNERGCVC